MSGDAEGQGRLRFLFDEERDLLEVVYPSCMDVEAVREAMTYMQVGPISSQGRALINLAEVEEITLTSADLVSFANQRARDFGDKSRTRQFNAFYGVKDSVRDTVDAWTWRCARHRLSAETITPTTTAMARSGSTVTTVTSTMTRRRSAGSLRMIFSAARRTCRSPP
jgi:hypothetical protein